MNYNESGIECSFIQNILYNFYTPTIKIIKERHEISSLQNEQHYIFNNSIYTHRDNKEVFFSAFEPGKKYLGITRNHISDSNNYNIGLHEALGHYLRFIRDYYDVDLMPMYNCFSNRFVDTFSLPITDERRKGSSVKPGYKLLAFPAKYGCNYSIFCKNNATALIQPAFFNGKKPLELFTPDNSHKWISFTPQPLSISQWEEHIYKIPDLNEIVGQGTEEIKQFYSHNEINLYLFIQIPENNADNLIIIENNSNKVVNNTLINNHLQKPFSDALLGYLLNYYISPLSDIDQNIAKIQKILSSKDFIVKDSEGNVYGQPMRLKNFEKGVFDPPTREFIYNLFRMRDLPDFTGYIDKNVESLILRESN